MGDISKDINSSFPNNKVKALINIIYTANWIRNKQNDFFSPYKITTQQYNILRILKGAGEALNVQTIKERMIERSPNTTRLMDKLCAKNLIKRIASKKDRRIVNVKITDEGLSLLEDIIKHSKNDILKGLTEEEAKQISNLLDKIR